MADKLVISLLPTNFGAIIGGYVEKWDDHIEWVRQNLDQIVKLVNENDKNLNDLKTPQVKKTTRKQSKSTVRSTMSRPSESLINSVMSSKTARITRSKSRLLKEHNMINEDGIMINVNEEKFKSELEHLDKVLEEKMSDAKLNENEKTSAKQQNKTPAIKIDESKENNMINEDDKMMDVNEEKSKSEHSEEVEEKKMNDVKLNENKSPALTIDDKSNEKKVSFDSKISKDETNEGTNQQLDDNKQQLSDKENESDNKEEQKSAKLVERVALKRSATVKSTPRPVVQIKRNKTNEFATPQSIKKLARTLNFGSAGKKIPRLQTATITKSSLVHKTTNSTSTTTTAASTNLPKLKKTDCHQTNHLEVPSHSSVNRHPIHPSLSASSSISSQTSAGSLKSCSSASQPSTKTMPRLNTNNANSESKQRCFGESVLKQKLEEEKKRKQMVQNQLTKEAAAQLKKENLINQRALEAKNKREERERKVREGKLQHDIEVEQRRIAEQKKQEELKRQLELQKQAEEIKKLAELRRQAEAKQLEEMRRQEEMKKQEEELKKQEELKRQDELRKQEEESKKQAEEKRLLELNKLNKEKPLQSAKKVEFKNTVNDDLQTKCFEKLEKKLIEDQMKCKNTPMKQLVVEAVGKTNAEKSLYKPEIDPSLDVIDLSLSSSDSSISIDEESDLKGMPTNNTFVKEFQNKTLLSSTFIKPQIKSKSPVLKLQKPNEPHQLPQINVQSTQSESKHHSVNETIIVLDTYDISDLQSDDEDDDEQRIVNKRIPNWAKGQEFIRAIKEQFSKRSRERENQIKKLFLSIESNIQLQEIFNGNQKFVSKRYERRTSSACWNSPPAVHIDHSFSRFY